MVINQDKSPNMFATRTNIQRLKQLFSKYTVELMCGGNVRIAQNSDG